MFRDILVEHDLKMIYRYKIPNIVSKFSVCGLRTIFSANWEEETVDLLSNIKSGALLFFEKIPNFIALQFCSP